jgi:hypothetical protein
MTRSSKLQDGVDKQIRLVAELPKEDSVQFNKLTDQAYASVALKYAWVAQLQGVVLRRNPLKMPPYKDYQYNRIAKADHGFFTWTEITKRGFGIRLSRICSA